MALDGNELAAAIAAQEALEAKRRKLGIPEHTSPKQEQSPRAGNIGPIASELVRDIAAAAQAPASGLEQIMRAPEAATRSPARAKERSTNTGQAGHSWGKLFLSLVGTSEYQSLRAREYRVLSVLIASRDNRNGGECAPGFEKIKALTGFSSRTVTRSLSELVNRGIIRQARKAHVGQNASYLTAESGKEIARNQEAKARHQ